jgi:hypothetical protein
LGIPDDCLIKKVARSTIGGRLGSMAPEEVCFRPLNDDNDFNVQNKPANGFASFLIGCPMFAESHAKIPAMPCGCDCDS